VDAAGGIDEMIDVMIAAIGETTGVTIVDAGMIARTGAMIGRIGAVRPPVP
jgi:hypothetical protein